MGSRARRVLAGRYELEQLIAVGGMGEVWRGRDCRLGRRVAVKLLRSEYTADETFLARFRAEATHAAALHHPNIAAVYDYGEATAESTGEHLAYLVMELVEGQPLSERLRAEGPMSPETTVSLLEQAAAALAEAHHAGLVHRDVKPGNILLRPDDSVKLTDFGIAWSASSVPLTEAGMVLGTPQYLSPEQAVGDPPSPASDVYSLGLVGYECLTGRAAFDGDNPVTIALKQVNQEPPPLPAEIPDPIRSLIEVALAKDPRDRIPDGAAFAMAVEQTVEEPPGPPTAPARVLAPVPTPVSAAPDTVQEPDRGHVISAPPRRRRQARLVLVPLLGVLLLLCAAAAVRPLASGSGAPGPSSRGTTHDRVAVVGPSFSPAARASDQPDPTPDVGGSSAAAGAGSGSSRPSGLVAAGVTGTPAPTPAGSAPASTTAAASAAGTTSTPPAAGTPSPAPGTATATSPAPGTATATSPAPGTATATSPAPGTATATSPASPTAAPTTGNTSAASTSSAAPPSTQASSGTGTVAPTS